MDAGLFNSPVNHVFETGAAGYDHRGHSQRVNGVVFEDLRQLLDVGCCIIEFWTGNNQFFAFEKILVEASQSKGRAIGSNQKITLVKIRSQG